MLAASATSAIAVRGDLNSDAEGAKVRDLAEKIDGSFGIAVFKFAVGGTHAAKRANLAIGADGFAGGGNRANILERAFPALEKGAIAKVVAVLMR
jgi:hypothetical protein